MASEVVKGTFECEVKSVEVGLVLVVSFESADSL
jgi:hypothetical protein